MKRRWMRNQKFRTIDPNIGGQRNSGFGTMRSGHRVRGTALVRRSPLTSHDRIKRRRKLPQGSASDENKQPCNEAECRDHLPCDSAARALRDSTKPMGVAAYRVSPHLPRQFEGELPTPDGLAREFPLMALIKVRIGLERPLRQMAQQHDISDGASALGPSLRGLAAVRGLPPLVADLGGTLRALDAAAQAADVSADAAALEAGTQLLDALRPLLEGT